MDEKIAIKFDKWQSVQEVMDKGGNSDSKSKLIIVGIAQTWNPPSMFVARELERLRKNKSTLPIYIIDHDIETNKTHSLNLHATPTILFYRNGKLMTIRRNGWCDDKQFVGTLSREQMSDLLQSARLAEKDNAPYIEVTF